MSGGLMADVNPGEVIGGRYEIRRPIAEGGMAVVVEAEHLVLRRRVALKLVSPRVPDPRWGEERLLREALVLARVAGPGVVEVLDAGGSPPCAYLAMEMIEGRSLESLLATRGAMDPTVAAAVVQELGGVLSRAHRLGVVHRDVKPSNVLLAVDERGQEGIKLIDFGIAALQGEVARELPKITKPGEFVGTLEYMAPEQIFQEPIGPATDVFSLGVLFYELLSGEVPFGTSYEAVMKNHLAGSERPSLSRRLGELGRRFDRILDVACARDAERRYRTADELADAIATEVGLRPGSLALLSGRPSAVSTGNDARAHVRAPYSTPVRVVRSNGLPVDGRTEDISRGGLLALLGTAPRHGEDVTVKFSLPTSGRVVSVAAVARWTRAARQRAAVGLQFVEAPPEVLADIEAYVALMGGPVEPSAERERFVEAWRSLGETKR
jgi:serine/threonine protein kinase